MKILTLIILLFISGNAITQEVPAKTSYNDKTYFVYPYRYDREADIYYSYGYEIGATEEERDIVPYPGNLPDGDYIMFYEPITEYRKKMWFFHRRGEYYEDTTRVAVIFSLKSNQKEGPADFYTIYRSLVETGSYKNNQKSGLWKIRRYSAFSPYDWGSYGDEGVFNSGMLVEYLNYSEGLRQGKYSSFYGTEEMPAEFNSDTNTLIPYSKGQYKDNAPAGTWRYFHTNKKLFKKFTLTDSIIPIDDYDFSYDEPDNLKYHGWYEIYYTNGQLSNRRLYQFGRAVQLDSGYFYNGKFSWINTVRHELRDTTEIKITEYKAFDSLGNLINHYINENDMRVVNYYFNNEGKLYSESREKIYYKDIRNRDTLLPVQISYDTDTVPGRITEITYKHFETGVLLRRLIDYYGNGYYGEMEDFSIKSDTVSDIYYVIENDYRGLNKEMEFRTYKHYYQDKSYWSFNIYTHDVDSVVLFYKGKRFNGKFKEMQGTWLKNTGKLKGDEKHLKYYTSYYGPRRYSGNPSFGYNSRKFYAYYGNNYKRFRGIRSNLINTEKGNYVNGYRQGEWINQHKRKGIINEVKHYHEGKMSGEQLTYLTEEGVDKWSDCIEIFDKKISHKKGIWRNKRYYLSNKESMLNGEFNGVQYQYYCNGRLSQKSEYKNGYKDGLLEMYSAGGRLTKQTNYTNGFFNGSYREWSTIGKPRYEASFEEGVLVGEYKCYHFNGNVSYGGSLQNGFRVGDWYTYFEDGTIKFKDTYTIADSSYYTFSSGLYADGVRAAERYIYNSNSCYSMQYYPSGQLASEGKILRNVRTGIWKFYDEGGNLLTQINYEPGFILQKKENGKVDTIQHHGFYESWYTNGKKQAEAWVVRETNNYDCYQQVNIAIQDLYYINFWDKENNQTVKDKSGRIKTYHLTTGKPESEGEMSDGLRTGYWRYWDPEGKLTEVGNYVNGERDGRWLSGDLEGMHYLDDACFDISNPRVLEDMELKKKILYIQEIIYNKGEILKDVSFKVDLNN